MANRKNLKKRSFGKAGGRHSVLRKFKYRPVNTFRSKLSAIPKSKSTTTKHIYNQKLKIFRKKVLQRFKFGKKKTFWRNRELFVSQNLSNYIIRRNSLENPFQFKISKVAPLSSDGYRLFNLEMLQQHITEISKHVALCDGAKSLACKDINPVKLVKEIQTHGLASLILGECNGCGKTFNLDSSPQIRKGKSRHYDINVRAVWGSMATGGGAAHLNETMATINSPGMSQHTYCKIEQEIGDMWGNIVEEDLLQAGMEERKIAIEKGKYLDGVPAISVICDGGWSKRSHKHSYNALGGVAVIIGVETGKLLYLGVRNKHCYICTSSESNHTQPPPHRCFRNWQESSQSMESEMILEGFLKAENTHGLRYTQVIADGDSSVYAKLQEGVPVWGKHIEKIECANHICKCLRTNLEKLVDDNPLYKGKNNLPKSIRIRLVSAVRCAIRMRSTESDKINAAKKLEHDIKNSVHHVYGNHTNCSDFCKKRPNDVNEHISNELHHSGDSTCASVPDVISELAEIWEDTTSVDLQQQSRIKMPCEYDLESFMLRDITTLLNRMAAKSKRLIGNFTTNIVESWMAIRCKFDGGKYYNRCNRGSWHSRCFGGSLRKNIGPHWSPIAWEKSTLTNAGYYFWKLYDQRDRSLTSCKKSKSTVESKTRRWKRKHQGDIESNSKKARMDYGPEAVDSVPDITAEELDHQKTEYLNKHINISEEKIMKVEKATKEQSVSAVWMDERKKRLTSSNFGCVISRNPKIKVNKLVTTLLYSKFKGNVHTTKGLKEEFVTIEEYKIKKMEQQKSVKVEQMGLVISRKNKFLAASPDGKVFEKECDSDGKKVKVNVGIIEVKNLLHNKPCNLFEAAKNVKNFCLEIYGKELRLKKCHKYFYQIQGQLNITKLPWVDFVVRTLNPYQMHIERIQIDEQLWENTMLPKLKSFYMKAILPELASPRYNTLSGIREPGLWYETNTSTHILSQQNKKTFPKCKAKATYEEFPPPGPSSSQGINRTRRERKVKFMGRRITHEWVINEKKNIKKWFNGEVVGLTKGKDGDISAVYEILYDGDEEAYEVDHLLEDYKSSCVKFIDL